MLIWSDRSAETGRSTVEISLSLSTTFVTRPAASSGCIRSRPRIRTVTFTLLPACRNFSIVLTLKPMSWSLVRGRNRISLTPPAF